MPERQKECHAMKANIYPGRPEQPDWSNVECLSYNQMPPHAYLIQFPDLSSCMHAASGNQRFTSPYVFMLNGSWNFNFYASINRLPENIISLRSGFVSIQVPSCWQTSGYDRNIDQRQTYLSVYFGGMFVFHSFWVVCASVSFFMASAAHFTYLSMEN
jgi:hypothetical protein